MSAIHCDSGRYGRGLSKSSCENAWEKMSRTGNPQELFPRPRGSEPTMPPVWRVLIRYLSDDGLCAIDVELTHYSKGDITGMTESIFSKCVEGMGQGGGAIAPCKSIILAGSQST